MVPFLCIDDWEGFPYECNKISKPTSRSLICVFDPLHGFHPFFVPMFCHLCNRHAFPIWSRLTVKRIFLTESNTGLLSKGSGHAELGSCWKASHVKMMIWWFCQRAIEFSNLTGVLWCNNQILCFREPLVYYRFLYCVCQYMEPFHVREKK